MSITPKTDEFIEGYIFGKIEKYIIEGFIHKDKQIMCAVTVPKSWFGLKPTRLKIGDGVTPFNKLKWI